MRTTAILFLLTGAYPLARAWRAGRDSTIRHALAWAAVAWLGWVAALLMTGPGESGEAVRYLALCLTGCAGVAVLGARRPGAGAWHFVTGGLLVVLLLPLAEGWGQLNLSPPRTLFLAGTLGVAFLNYLPTRLAPAALLLAFGCGVELWGLAAESHPPGSLTAAARLAVAAAPWTAYAAATWPRRPGSEFDRVWRAFRDRFGGLWGLRMREQFNRAAANAGWRVHLGWDGLRSTDGPPAAEVEATLRALLQRFEREGPDQ